MPKLKISVDYVHNYLWSENLETLGDGELDVEPADLARWTAAREAWDAVQTEIGERANAFYDPNPNIEAQRMGAEFIEAGMLPNYLASHARVNTTVGEIGMRLINTGHHLPAPRSQLYAMAGQATAGETEARFIVGCDAFRPNKLYTNVEAPGLAFLTGIYLKDDPENQFLGERVDLWNFSLQHEQQLRKAFLEEHGLTDKTNEDIDDYLDEHELSMPSNPRLELPTLSKGNLLRMTGEFPCTVGFSWIGMAVL